MHSKSMGIVGRSVIALAMGTALTVGGASLASASSFHSKGGNCASARVSSFDYASGGTGGYVTAVTPTSVTIQSWNGTSTTYALTSATTYTEGKAPSTAVSLVVGDRVEIGVSSTSPTTATSVSIELAMLFGTVTSVSGSTITIKDPQGFTRTIVEGTATTYTLNGASSTIAAVVDGAKIIAEGTIDPNGTSLDALSIAVGSAGQMGFTYGTVTAVTSSSVTVLAKDGTSTTFTYSTSTGVKALGDTSATLTTSDLAVGEHVGVSFDSSAATTAVTIDIKLAHISGTVSAVSGDNITVQDHQGFTHLVLVGTATTYAQQGGGTASLVSVIVGARIRAEGVIDTNGTTLDALTVVICTTTTTPLPTPQVSGGRHHHHGGFSDGSGTSGSGGNSRGNHRF
ncbi:MAG TPA: DUF5666 domain-containing protein [Acidimicrobiales bacterium]